MCARLKEKAIGGAAGSRGTCTASSAYRPAEDRIPRTSPTGRDRRGDGSRPIASMPSTCIDAAERLVAAHPEFELLSVSRDLRRAATTSSATMQWGAPPGPRSGEGARREINYAGSLGRCFLPSGVGGTVPGASLRANTRNAVCARACCVGAARPARRRSSRAASSPRRAELRPALLLAQRASTAFDS